MALLQTDNNELENYNPAKRITLSIQRVPMILIKSPLLISKHAKRLLPMITLQRPSFNHDASFTAHTSHSDKNVMAGQIH